MALVSRLIKAVVLASVMGGASWLADHYTPKTKLAEVRPPVVLEQMVPKRMARWRIDESQPMSVADLSANELSDRIYAATLSRTYVNDAGDRIMLAIAYGKDQSEGTQVHTPEYCYPAQDYAIGDSTTRMIDFMGGQHSAVQLVAKSNVGGRIEPITYWIVMGDYVVTSGQKQRRNVRFYYGFQGFVPDGVFFRVSSLGADTARQYQLQQDFINDLFATMSPQNRDRLAGKQDFSKDWLFI